MKSFTLTAIMAAYASAVALNDADLIAAATENDIDVAGIVGEINANLGGDDIAADIGAESIEGELKGSESATGDLAGSSNEDILSTINDTLSKNIIQDKGDKHDRANDPVPDNYRAPPKQN